MSIQLPTIFSQNVTWKAVIRCDNVLQGVPILNFFNLFTHFTSFNLLTAFHVKFCDILSQIVIKLWHAKSIELFFKILNKKYNFTSHPLSHRNFYLFSIFTLSQNVTFFLEYNFVHTMTWHIVWFWHSSFYQRFCSKKYFFYVRKIYSLMIILKI